MKYYFFICKVLNLLLETMNIYLRLYKRDLNDWLSKMLLIKLLTLLSNQSIASVSHQNLRTCCETIRTSFDHLMQFKICIQFLKEQRPTTSLNVQLNVLKYLKEIIYLMEPNEFSLFIGTSQADLKPALLKIFTFTDPGANPEIKNVIFLFLFISSSYCNFFSLIYCSNRQQKLFCQHFLI